MVRLRSISSCAPLLCALLVALSVCFPSRDLRLVRSLSHDVDGLRRECSDLRSNLVATVLYLRSDAFLAALGDAGLPSVPTEAVDPVNVSDVEGLSYMCASGRDGLRSASDWWLVGDYTPWGFLESSFRGGFVADGVRYRIKSPAKSLVKSGGLDEL